MCGNTVMRIGQYCLRGLKKWRQHALMQFSASCVLMQQQQGKAMSP